MDTAPNMINPVLKRRELIHVRPIFIGYKLTSKNLVPSLVLPLMTQNTR